MNIDCVADLHGFFPELPGGDLLIIAGDLTAKDELVQYLQFNKWLSQQKYRRKIVVAGNHDNYCELGMPIELLPGENKKNIPISADKAIYLEDSGCTFEALKIWGSPWTKTFEGMNPNCKAFTCDTEEELEEKWKLIPDDIDILITHSPPLGKLDKIKIDKDMFISIGSRSLETALIQRPSIVLHVFGHIHEGYGKQSPHRFSEQIRTFVNCSHVNEHYQPVNKPVRMIL